MLSEWFTQIQLKHKVSVVLRRTTTVYESIFLKKTPKPTPDNVFKAGLVSQTD